jgi:hypothetical protein
MMMNAMINAGVDVMVIKSSSSSKRRRQQHSDGDHKKDLHPPIANGHTTTASTSTTNPNNNTPHPTTIAISSSAAVAVGSLSSSFNKRKHVATINVMGDQLLSLIFSFLSLHLRIHYGDYQLPAPMFPNEYSAVTGSAYTPYVNPGIWLHACKRWYTLLTHHTAPTTATTVWVGQLIISVAQIRHQQVPNRFHHSIADDGTIHQHYIHAPAKTKIGRRDATLVEVVHQQLSMLSLSLRVLHLALKGLYGGALQI